MQQATIERIRDGDLDAYEVVVRQYQGILLGYAAHRLPDIDAAQDVVQLTFIRAFEQLDEYEPERDFGVWLCVICKHFILTELERQRRESRNLENYGHALRIRVGEAMADVADLDDIVGARGKPIFKPGDRFRLADATEMHKQANRAYLANVSYVDHCIGVTLDALEESDHANNTIVMIWGDHGWHLSEKLHYGKTNLWEESARVPLIVKVPGATANNVRCERFVNLIDMYPTLIELCGLPPNKENDGRSFAPLLTDPSQQWNFPTLGSENTCRRTTNRTVQAIHTTISRNQRPKQINRRLKPMLTRLAHADRILPCVLVTCLLKYDRRSCWARFPIHRCVAHQKETVGATFRPLRTVEELF